MMQELDSGVCVKDEESCDVMSCRVVTLLP